MAAQAVGVKHHRAFHCLFATACWSRDELGLGVFRLIEPWCGEMVMLALDDTLVHKRGRKLFGAGMHHDPLLSSRKTAIMNFGHSWVTLLGGLKLYTRHQRARPTSILLHRQ